MFLRSKRYGKSGTLFRGVMCGELVYSSKVPVLLRGAFVEKFYTKGGFRANSWQNLNGFMPRKGYDMGTKKKCRTAVWCGFPSSKRIWRSNNHLRWSPVLQHRRPPLQHHELEPFNQPFSTIYCSKCTKGGTKGTPLSYPFRTTFVPFRGYERVRKATKGVTKGYPFVDSTESLPIVPLSYPFRGPTKGYERGRLSYNVIAKKWAKRGGKCFKTTLNGPSLNR